MLVKCSECGAKVSDAALKCPQCGKQLRKPTRGVMSKIFLWLFYLFNILMLIWFVGGMNSASEIASQATSEAERAGAAIGTGIGATFVLFIWAIGDIITGLLAFMSRPKA